MAPKTKKSTTRITSKTTIIRAIELIASEEIRDTSRKPIRVSYKVNPAVSKILLQIVAKDLNLGWQVLYGCDAMSLYGNQIIIALEGYCAGMVEIFEFFAAQRKEDMARYVDKQRKASD